MISSGDALGRARRGYNARTLPMRTPFLALTDHPGS